MKFISTSKDIINEATKKIDVYRLEHIDTHTGPYQTKLKDGSRFDLADKFPISPKYNPAPSKDKKLANIKDLATVIKNGLFSFESLQHMRRWFSDKAIQWMLDDIKEFVIIKKSMPSNKVVKGETQCIVDKKAWIKAPSKIVKF